MTEKVENKKQTTEEIINKRAQRYARKLGWL